MAMLVAVRIDRMWNGRRRKERRGLRE